MSVLIQDVVDEALTLVGEIGGPGVAQYSEDRMVKDVIRAFNMLFKKYNWEQYKKWFRVELDGTTGIILTDSFEQIKDFEDFISVHRDTEAHSLPIFPKGRNPYVTALSNGARTLYWTSLHVTHTHYKKRRLQFYPITAEGFINVQAMEYPLVPPATRLTPDDELHLDTDMLVCATAFVTLSMDDLNPGAAQVAKGFLDMRYRDIMAKLSDHPIPITSYGDIPLEWSVAP